MFTKVALNFLILSVVFDPDSPDPKKVSKNLSDGNYLRNWGLNLKVK
jgi:hypothetical protein